MRSPTTRAARPHKPQVSSKICLDGIRGDGHEPRGQERRTHRIAEPRAGPAVRRTLSRDVSLDGAFRRGGRVDRSAPSGCWTSGRVDEEIPLAAVEKFEARGMVGGGVLEARVGGEDRLLARFTASHLPRYTAVASYLNKRLPRAKGGAGPARRGRLSHLRPAAPRPGTKVCPPASTSSGSWPGCSVLSSRTLALRRLGCPAAGPGRGCASSCRRSTA